MYLENPTTLQLVEAAQATLSHCPSASIPTVFFFLGEHCGVDITELIQQMNHQQIPFAGGSFPSVFSGSQQSSQGAIITAFPALADPQVIQGLQLDDIELPDFADIFEIESDRQPTALVLVDGLTANIGGFLEEMYDALGNSVHYFGGGAGSLTLQQKPCLFNPDGCFQDAAIVTFIALNSSLGVSHGWERLHGPLLASKTRKNIVSKLNWKEAFETYRTVVEADSNQKLTPENFFDIAKGYPFGLMKEDQEDIVRDPIIVNQQGELICVGEVPENASLYILKGNPASLTSAAYAAAKHSADLPGGQPYTTFIVDCISRVLFLEDQFQQELAAIQKGCATQTDVQTPEGILTLGEISSYGEGFLEWFNKTIVVGTFYSQD